MKYFFNNSIYSESFTLSYPEASPHNTHIKELRINQFWLVEISWHTHVFFKHQIYFFITQQSIERINQAACRVDMREDRTAWTSKLLCLVIIGLCDLTFLTTIFSAYSITTIFHTRNFFRKETLRNNECTILAQSYEYSTRSNATETTVQFYISILNQYSLLQFSIL